MNTGIWASILGIVVLVPTLGKAQTAYQEDVRVENELSSDDFHRGLGSTNSVGRRQPEPCSATPDSAEMEFEYECFDLESGTAYEMDIYEPLPRADFIFAYNADTGNHIRLFQLYPTKIAFLDGKTFEDMSCEDLAMLAFTQQIIDLPLDPDDTVALLTTEGNFFKVGNAYEQDDFMISFDFAKLCLPCGDANEKQNIISQHDADVLVLERSRQEEPVTGLSR